MDRDLRETPLFRAVDRRKGSITLSDRRWNRHRTRPVRLAYPVAPLALPARLAPSPALRIAPPRLTADLDAGLIAAGPEQYWCPRSHDAQITTCRWHRLQVNRRPVSHTRFSQEQGRPGREIA